MFKLKVQTLQEEVAKMVSAAKRSRLVHNPIFVTGKKESGTVTLSFKGDVLAVQKTIETEVTQDIEFSVSVYEFQLKVSSLPDDEDVEFVMKKQNKNIVLKWGRNNGIILLTLSEENKDIELPEIGESLTLPKGKWHYFSRNVAPFCAMYNDKVAKKFPALVGVHFSKCDTGVVVEATNSTKAIRVIEEISWFSVPLIIPSEVIHAVAEIISSKETIQISLSDLKSHILIETDSVKVIARVLDGDFVNTENLFCGKDAAIVWRTDRMELLETTRRVKRLGGTLPTLHVLKKESKHYAILKDILNEQIGAVIESEQEEGFIVNPNNLEAALTVLRSEEVLLAFEGNTKPITILSGDEEEEKNDIKVMISQMKEV